MTERCIDIFFYGLFMDRDILRERQVMAVNPRRAYVDDYALCIGKRAMLVPSTDSRVYGMVFALTHCELDKLYSAPGLEQYRPDAVLACSMDGDPLPALCYNLPKAPGPDETNADYAARLRAVLAKRNFPPEYIASIP
ncbi:gamma-glutamylcyclotransferase family protein [Kangiella shandongensis]|uniref:gamma-glutamylcyclotransferase family protein n=1 Tax=Kangiella shandongensis TaxID=2763258 RepID=UPI001CBB2E1D|nr:gamma-glutamylcyclotransferase family protein [Kangiella shandongensis]